MSLVSRREYVRAMKDRYRAAKTKKERRGLLDEVTAVTGYNRKYAIRLLGVSDRPLRPKKRRQRKRLYARCLPVIALCWEALDYCCAERLHPRLVIVTEQLIGHRIVYPDREMLHGLTHISLSTLARRLREMPSPKARMVPRSRSNSLIKCDVPVKRYDWDEDRPGALEADLVEHNGGFARGQYACTLSVTDVVTGWSRRRAVMGRGQAGTHEALALIFGEWPYPCWGLHADNGSEFLADHIQRFLAKRQLEHTRSRPYKKNDNAHVEQRNRFIREMIGYERYDTPEAVVWLNQVYEMLDLYANLVLPSMKLVRKRRYGSKVRKTYDTPRPPLERALEAGVVPQADRERLQKLASTLNPLDLHRQLEVLINRGPQAVRSAPERAVAGAK